MYVVKLVVMYMILQMVVYVVLTVGLYDIADGCVDCWLGI